MPSATRDTRLMALTLGTVVGLQSGENAWGRYDPGEVATVTRGLAQTISSPNPNPDDVITISCYEEDSLHKQLIAFANLLKGDVLGVIPTGGSMRTPTVNLVWQSATLTRPGSSEAGRTPSLMTWTFSVTGANRVAL